MCYWVGYIHKIVLHRVRKTWLTKIKQNLKPHNAQEKWRNKNLNIPKALITYLSK